MNFGDPVLPPPSVVELPRLVPLGQPTIFVLGYPLTMVLAEKIVTAIDRGEANTGWRDFADVLTITRLHRVRAVELLEALNAVAAHRHVTLSCLLPDLAEMPRRAQPKWRPWRARMGREHDLPPEFADVLEAVSRFADPVIGGAASGTWSPQAAEWGR